MSFEQAIRIGEDRIGVLVGKGGSVKEAIEERCKVRLRIDSRSGEVMVSCDDPVEGDPFKALQIVNAIARGFSPKRAMDLLQEGKVLEIVDLRPYGGKSKDALVRIKGRIIGKKGKARRVIEELTGCHLSVYGHTVAIVGDAEGVRLAREAVELLASGSTHGSVYRMLQRARTRAKRERLELWEDARIG